MTREVKVRSKSELVKIECKNPNCNTIFRVNPRKRRTHVHCPACGEKIELEERK